MWLEWQTCFEVHKCKKRQSVIEVTQEKTSGKGMSLDVDGRQEEKGKTEHSAGGNCKGWMHRWEMSGGQQSIDGMVEHAVAV